MRILVMGLDCAAPELLLEEELPHLRRLMAGGVYGTLQSVIPPITVPAWLCMATSQDPGSLGLYGFRNRVDHSYEGLRTVDSRWIRAQTLWDQIAMEGGRSILIGVPPSYPPGRMNGIRVGCFLTPDSREGTFTHPPEVSDRIRDLVGHYPVDVQDFRTEDKDRLHREIVGMTRTHFEVIRHFLETETWDYLQFVEIGLDRIHHGFWKHHDPRHRHHDPDSPWKEVVREYYRLLDHEIGSVLDLLEEDTLLLVVSDHGAKPLDGGVCVNEWLVREGFLTLRRRPREVTPFQELEVDWGRTRAWSTGGYYARIFLNVKGREPEGAVEPGDVEALREELASRLEALPDDRGRPMATRAYKPEFIYRRVEGMPPDLIVHFGDLSWRAIGGVGYDSVHVQENDTGPDDCNHSQHGAFILAGPGVPAGGRVDGAHLLDVAPTLLRAGGYDIPASMQGRDLLESNRPGEGQATQRESDEEAPPPVEGEALVRERLKGLGYIG